MTAPNECLKRRVYNVTAMSFTPEELVDKIYKYVPELRVTYKPDSRQSIGRHQYSAMNFISSILVNGVFVIVCNESDRFFSLFLIQSRFLATSIR